MYKRKILADILLTVDSVVHCTDQIAMETKCDSKKTNSVSGLRIEQVAGSVESPTDGMHMYLTIRKSIRNMYTIGWEIIVA